MAITTDPYVILGVTPGASHEEIRSAYLRLAKIVHPDRGGSASLFHLVQDAYRMLSTADPAAFVPTAFPRA